MSATCGNCRHWLKHSRVPTDGSDTGTCYGAPPSIVRIGEHLRSMWPDTSEWHHCGAWSPAVPPPDPAPQESAD